MDKCAFLSCKFMLFLFVDLLIGNRNYVVVLAYIFRKICGDYGFWVK